MLSSSCETLGNGFDMGTILVIDDRKDILTTLEYVLEEDFERIITKQSPESAMKVLDEESVDVVLLDMNFHLGVNNGAEGFFWLEQIKKKRKNVPVVLFTAYGDIDTAVKGLKNGASDFVTKPWDNDDLRAKLKNVMEQSRKQMRTLDEVENEHIQMTLEKCKGNLSMASGILGITRQTLYNKIKSKSK